MSSIIFIVGSLVMEGNKDFLNKTSLWLEFVSSLSVFVYSTFLSICKRRPSKKTSKTFWRDGRAFSKWWALFLMDLSPFWHGFRLLVPRSSLCGLSRCQPLTHYHGFVMYLNYCPASCSCFVDCLFQNVGRQNNDSDCGAFVLQVSLMLLSMCRLMEDYAG